MARTNATSRVLLVEDDEAWSHLTREAFADAAPGVILELAVDALTALARLGEEPRPDVVLLDVHLPGADGREVLRAIREEPWGRDLPVIVLSASVADKEREALAEFGLSAIVTKPTRFAALREFVERVVRRDFDGLASE